MFGALNRFISRLDSDSTSQGGLDAAYGFQVLRNTDPELHIEPWFDFIIGINGRQIDNPEPALLTQEIHNCAGSTVNLIIYSAKGARTRTLSIPVPSPPLLNLTLQWTPLSTTHNTWHILEVTPHSPAEVAGLLPYGDYIIGTPEGIVRGEAGLGELVEDHLSRPLHLYVYNHEYNVTREITINPSRNWGGEGALGCVLGFGALHRIPPPLDAPPEAPGETLFDTTAGRFSNEEDSAPLAGKFFTPAAASTEFLVPANQLGAQGPPLPGKSVSPAHGRSARKKHHGISPKRAMDEYFAEGEKKSKEQDFTPAVKGVAPPPKAGGPPRGTSPIKEPAIEG